MNLHSDSGPWRGAALNMKPLKIAILAFSYLPRIGGAQIFTYQLATRLAKRGHQVTVFLPIGQALRLSRSGRSFYHQIRSIPYSNRAGIRWISGLAPGYLVAQLFTRHFDLWQAIGVYPAGYFARFLSGKIPVVLRAYGRDIQKDREIGYGDRRDKIIEKKRSCIGMLY